MDEERFDDEKSILGEKAGQLKDKAVDKAKSAAKKEVKKQAKKAAKKVAKEFGKQVAKEGVKAAAQTAGTTAGGTVAAAGTTAGGTVAAGGAAFVIGTVAIIALIILIVILLIGLISAIIFMPSFILSTIKEWIETGITGVVHWLGGDESKFKREEMVHILDNATYIRRMGFNLYNDGFIYKKVDQVKAEAELAKKNKKKDKDKDKDKVETVDKKIKAGEITEDDTYVTSEGIYEDESRKC
jgi:hypothetical protein